jgi:hypothetical protein
LIELFHCYRSFERIYEGHFNTFHGNVGFLNIFTVFSVEPIPLSNHLFPSQHHLLLQIKAGVVVVQFCFQYLVGAEDVVLGREVETGMAGCGGRTEVGTWTEGLTGVGGEG